MKKSFVFLTLSCLLIVLLSLSSMTVLQASAAPTTTVTSSENELLAPVPPANPVLWLTAEGNAADSSGHHNDGSLINGVTFTEGRFGQGFAFNGSGMVKIADSSSLNFGSGEFSGFLWFRQDGGGYFYLVDSDRPMNNNSSWFIFINGATAGFVAAFGDGTGDHRVTTYGSNYRVVNDGKWHFLTWVRSSDSMKMYLDGALRETTSVRAGNVTNGLPISIGAEYNDDKAEIASGFNGIIDEVAFFDRALSEEEIQGQYRITSPVSAAPASDSLQMRVSGNLNANSLTLDIRLSPSKDLANAQVFLIRDDGNETLVGPAAEHMIYNSPPIGGRYRIEARENVAQGAGPVLASASITVLAAAATPAQVAGTIAAGFAVVSLVTVAISRGFNFLDWLRAIVGRVLGNKARERTKNLFAWRLSSLLAVTVALILMAVILAAGKPGGFNFSVFLEALIVTGVAAIIFQSISIGGGVLLAHIRHQEMHYRLWTAGSIAFAFTNILLHLPLGYTGFLEGKKPGMPVDLGSDARCAIAALGLIGMMVGIFLAMGLAVKFTFAQTGISLALGSLGVAAIPFSTLTGHALWKWSKLLGISVGIASLALYFLFQIGLLQEAALWGVGITGLLLFLSIVLYEMFVARQVKRGETTLQPVSPEHL